MKRLFLVALATLNLALTGCGHVAGGVAPQALQVHSTATATIMAAGHAHKLGFDLDRYQAEQAPKAHPRHLPARQGITPPVVDLRAFASPVEDQEDLSSCTAFAVGKGMREMLQNVRHEAATPLSALFLYYETRKTRGPKFVVNDCGGTLTDAMKTIATVGDAPEAAWGYDMGKFAIQPPAEAYAAAGTQKLATGVQLAGLEDIKTAIASQQPVVLGMRLYRSFGSIGQDGVMPMPQANETAVGGHAVTIVGYDNQRQVLIVKNSFGTNWGDQGYFYMPYAFVTPGNVMDIWTAK